MRTLPRELTVPTGIRLLVANLDHTDYQLPQQLDRNGYAVAGRVTDQDALLAKAMTANFDVVVIFALATSDRLLEIIAKLARAVDKPIALFSEDGERATIRRAVTAGVNAYVVTGVNANRIRSAIDLAAANFESTVGLREELDEARQALQERRVVERAKGIVMKQRGLSEADAYKLMRTRAMQKGMRLIDIALTITEAEDLMG